MYYNLYFILYILVFYRLPELELCPTPRKTPIENNHTNTNDSNICDKPLKKKRKIWNIRYKMCISANIQNTNDGNICDKFLKKKRKI